MRKAAQKIQQKYNVSDFFALSYERQEKHRHVRGYKGKPDRVETKVRYQIHVEREQEKIDIAYKRLGWRLYVANAEKKRLPTREAVSRGANWNRR